MSRPTRACGLKRAAVWAGYSAVVWSRPTRACGLKLGGIMYAKN